MENTTSLRFLEASGRPSGTGRPSLPTSRADEEPAQECESFEASLGAAQEAPPEERAPVELDPTALEVPGAIVPAAQAPVLVASLPQALTAEAPGPRPSGAAVPLPATVALAAAAAAPLEDFRPAFEPLRTDAPSLALVPESAAAREAALDVPPLFASEARSEPTAPAPTKAPPPAPPAPDMSERAGEILRQVRVQLSPELRTATIQLSPPELGRISIRIRVERGELRALVRAERPETLAALERHVPELKATLEQLGIQARQFDLQLGLEQRGPRDEQPEPRPQGHARGADEHDPRVREHERRLARTLSAHAGGVDTFA